MLVKEIMQTDVARCHVDTNLQAVALLMWNHDCGAIPVVDSADRPIGVVTDRDIAMGCSLNNRALSDMRAGDVIGNRPLFSCRESDELDAALGLMRDYKIRRLPVIDDSETLRGMLSLSDLIQAAQKNPSRSKTVKKLSFDQLVEALKSVTAPYTERKTKRTASR
ncbi:CBS domain-containing protein [Proteobacteria bacterium 005FR1]|nr:CBS domain-containing protein [Proteobacteria bacterium 005FR1]